jgi:hypothetical protein
MGYEVGMGDEKGISSEDRQQILSDLSSGRLTAEEALELLGE